MSDNTNFPAQGEKTAIRPNSNGYQPRPLDTADIKLNDNLSLLSERIAGHFHNVWGKAKIQGGWAYGPYRDEENRTNPVLKYYSELTEEQKNDNRISATQAIKFIMSKGYSIEERKKPSMADIMKMAWTDHGRREEDLNFDATVFIGVFGTDEQVDEKRMTSALHSFYASLYNMFGQKKAISGASVTAERLRKHAHTRFAILSPLQTSTEVLAAKIASGYGIDTYKVVSDITQTNRERKIIGVSGDVTDAICDGSFLSLAMWNGSRTGRVDKRMTAIVERALKGSRERLLELDMPDNISVFHMLTPTGPDDTGTPEHKLYTIRVLHPYPLETGTSWYFRGGKSKAKNTDKYNRERFERCVERVSRFNETIRKRHSEVMATEQVHDLMPGLHGHVSTDRDLLRHLYADLVSFSAQKRRDRQTRWMMWTAIIGLGLYAVMPDLPSTLFGANIEFLRPVLSALILLSLTAAMIIFFLQRRSGSHNEYVNFRMIAECLRVQTYWKAAGIDDSVEDEFGAKSKFDFEWARYILRSWALSDSMYHAEDKEFSGSILHEVTRTWLGREDEFADGEYRHEKTGNVDQYGYTRNKAEKSLRYSQKENRIRVFSIAVAYVLTAVVALLIVVLSVVNKQPYYAEWFDYLAMFAGVVQVCVAGYNLYSATKDHDRMVNNNTWLSIEYQKAIIACKYVSDEERHRELLRQTGGEAIKEACGWALEFSRNEPSSPIS